MPTTTTRKTTRKTTAKKGAFTAPKSDGPTMTVRTPNKPGGQQVNAAKYHAMKKVMLKVMPAKAPGYTQTEMMAAVMKAAPKDTFPQKTSMWWAKCVQLDLETRGELVREPVTPLRWHKP